MFRRQPIADRHEDGERTDGNFKEAKAMELAGKIRHCQCTIRETPSRLRAEMTALRKMGTYPRDDGGGVAYSTLYPASRRSFQ